jgi:hypothetical protein
MPTTSFPQQQANPSTGYLIVYISCIRLHKGWFVTVLCDYANVFLIKILYFHLCINYPFWDFLYLQYP